MFGIAGDADGRAQVDMLATEVEAFAQRELDGAGNAAGRVEIGHAGDEQGEFIPRQAADQAIARARAGLRHGDFAQAAGNARQQLVARRMAQRVVHALEPVQVDEEQGRKPFFAAFRQQPFDLPAEAGAVGKAGHLIEQRERLNMVQVGADLAEQAFHRHGQVGQFPAYVPRHGGLQVAMGRRQQAFGRTVDGAGGRGHGTAGGGPAERAAQDRDDEGAADAVHVGRLPLPKDQGQDEHQRPRGAGEGSGAARQCHALHESPYPRQSGVGLDQWDMKDSG